MTPPEIITLGVNDQIDKPGFYRLPLSRHHSQPCVGPSVTSSVLRNIEAGASPEEVYETHALNPEADHSRPDTVALRLGRAMAALMEGRTAFNQEFIVLPSGRPDRPLPSQIEAFKRGEPSENGLWRINFWSKIEAGNRTPVEEDEFKILMDMANRLSEDPASVMLEGEPEITMAWYDEKTKLWVLSRPDTISFSGSAFDYKRMAPGAGQWFTRRLVDSRIDKLEIHMQMALAWEAMEKAGWHRPSEVGIIAQSSTPPYPVIAREIDAEDLEIGRFQCHRAMRIFSESYYSGDWWGPGREIGVFNMNTKKRERLLEDMQTENWNG